jgi:pimeloyl-ACP methyl ester carboxylesterase
LFAVVLVRFLAVVLQAFYFRYPSFKRRFAGVLSLSIEIALIWNIWIDLQTYNVQAILISLIVFSVFLTIGEFWILTSKESLARAEERLLKAYGINTVVEHCPHSGMSYFKVKSDSSRILVLTHGYFGGKCSFAPIIKELSKNYTIYCVDWIGMGSSSRLFWWVMANDSNQVENAYLVAFDKWRKFQGIEKFDLLGHSFGGYLVGLYAIKYPEYVENLILASPLGIPPLNGIPEDSKSMFPGFLSVLWNLRITPHFIIKLIGPFAEKIFESGARRRFGEDLDHIEEFSDYIFHINAAPISGEIGLSVMFYIGAYAKRPLGRRILDSEIASKLNRIIFLYGSYDWMDSKTGSLLSQQICQQYSPTKSSTIILEDCGHQMFLESRHAIKFCKAINSLF